MNNNIFNYLLLFLLLIVGIMHPFVVGPGHSFITTICSLALVFVSLKIINNRKKQKFLNSGINHLEIKNKEMNYNKSIYYLFIFIFFILSMSHGYFVLKYRMEIEPYFGGISESIIYGFDIFYFKSRECVDVVQKYLVISSFMLVSIFYCMYYYYKDCIKYTEKLTLKKSNLYSVTFLFLLLIMLSSFSVVGWRNDGAYSCDKFTEDFNGLIIIIFSYYLIGYYIVLFVKLMQMRIQKHID